MESNQEDEAPHATELPIAGAGWDEEQPNRRIRLRNGAAILLESDGFRLIEARGLRRSPRHPYESLTHVYVGDRMLLIGTTKTLLTVRVSEFSDPEAGPRAVRDALLARLARRPDGRHVLEQIEHADALGKSSSRPYLIWLVAGLCMLAAFFQLRDPMIEQVGSFIPDLFGRGEYWRAVTANFLHGFSPAPGPLRFLFGAGLQLPLHLAINVGGLLVLGHLVERPLGPWRTAIVLAFGGAGSAAGIILAGHHEVIGASGLVAALAGALLALELHHSRALPSYWRLPRRMFVIALVLQFGVIDQLLSSYVAGGAHLGGFAGGYAAVWLLGRPSVESLVPTPTLRFSSTCAGVLLVVGIVGILPLARHDMGALERHAARLLNTPPSFYLYRHENAAAWFIATEGGASPDGIDLAIALADRAVTSTARMHPGILDTLAEALFQRGDRLAALLTIDEAIGLMPREPYFHEQRRRFTGERDPEDRPPQPGEAPAGALPFEDELDPRSIDPSAPRITL